MKIAINYFFEILLFLVYLVFYRLPKSVQLYTKIKSYSDWRIQTDGSGEYVFQVAFYIFGSIWYFSNIWISILTIFALFVVSVIIGAVKTIIKNRSNV